MDEPEPGITMLLPDAARQLGISPWKGYQLAASGNFPGAFRIGRVWRVHRATFADEVARMARGEPISPGDQVLERALDETRFRLARSRRDR